jgi:predicted enzyme related to lactoylglutathione lyase
MKKTAPKNVKNKAALQKKGPKPRHLFGHGRLSYIQIPAVNVRDSARFYAGVFGWQIRGGGDDHLSFTDATGDMIGAWVTGRAPSREPGVLPYIYVHGIDAMLERVQAGGGEIVKPACPEGDLWVATFRDPAGNVVGVWQQGPR